MKIKVTIGKTTIETEDAAEKILTSSNASEEVKLTFLKQQHEQIKKVIIVGGSIIGFGGSVWAIHKYGGTIFKTIGYSAQKLLKG